MSAEQLTDAAQLLLAVPDLTADDYDTDAEQLDPAGRLRSRLVSGDDILNMQPPAWMIPGVLRASSVTMFYGPSGVGKSFVTVDLAGALRTGHDWQGRRHDTVGPVLYLAGEGVAGMQQRLRAWAELRGYDVADVLRELHILPGGLPMHLEADANELVALCDELQPVAVIVDTLHTHVTGASDSDDKHMGPFVRTCHRIAARTGAAVVFVHHTNKAEQEYRGSTALYGNVDTVLSIKGDTRSHATITVKKQKDGQDGEQWFVRFDPWGTDPETHGPASLVASATARPASVTDAEPKKQQMLDALVSIAGPNGEPELVWAQAVHDLHGWGLQASGTKSSTGWNQLRKELVETGRVLNVGTMPRPRYAPAPDPEQLTLT